MRKFFNQKIKELKNNMEEKTKKEVNTIAEKKQKQIKQLTEDHAQQFTNMKNYYDELNKKNLNQLKTLAKNFSDALNEQNKLTKMKRTKEEKKKKIEEPMTKLLAKINE